MTNGKKDAHKSISILKEEHRERKCQVREAVGSVPHKTLNPKLFSSAEFSDAKGFFPKYARMDLPHIIISWVSSVPEGSTLAVLELSKERRWNGRVVT